METILTWCACYAGVFYISKLLYLVSFLDNDLLGSLCLLISTILQFPTSKTDWFINAFDISYIPISIGTIYIINKIKNFFVCSI